MSEQAVQSDPDHSSSDSTLPWKTFLEKFPLNTEQCVSEYWHLTQNNFFRRSAPTLRLWCPKSSYNGIRNFDGHWEHHGGDREKEVCHDFLVYKCRDCGQGKKTYCIASQALKDKGKGRALKLGEFPEAHIDLPSRLPTLLGEDYPTFIKGLKCEKQGLGIGAYSYYRRVVENMRNRLIAEIIKVARRLNAKPEMIVHLEEAQREVQFEKAVAMIKASIPESLLYDGHNPLTLLHSAISIGLHEESDDDCLQRANIIRLVLSDLAESIQQALRDRAELHKAVSNLLQVHSAKKKKVRTNSGERGNAEANTDANENNDSEGDTSTLAE